MINNRLSEVAIRGDCSFFACRCCRTKFGWAHQKWCEIRAETFPTCSDCQYYNAQARMCRHPVVKKEGKENLPYEENQHPV